MISINFHIGLHKTGTTFVQKVYEKLQDKSTCVAYVGPETPAFAPLRNHLLQARNGNRVEMEELYAKTQEFMANFKSADKIFISDENIIGATPLSYSTKNSKTLYPRLSEQVSLISEIFSTTNLELTITTRPFSKFIKSLYLDGLKYFRYSMTLDEYIQHHEIETFNPTYVAGRASEAFSGRVNIHSVDRIMNPNTLANIGLIDGSHAHENISISRANTSMALSKASICRLFGNLPHAEKKAIKAWIESCPAPLSDRHLKFKDVELSNDALNKIFEIEGIDIKNR